MSTDHRTAQPSSPKRSPMPSSRPSPEGERKAPPATPRQGQRPIADVDRKVREGDA